MGVGEVELCRKQYIDIRAEVPPIALFSRVWSLSVSFFGSFSCLSIIYCSNFRRRKLHGEIADLSGIENTKLCICICFVALK